MPKHYSALPTKDQWKKDLGLHVPLMGNRKSPNPPLERIGKLIEEIHHGAPEVMIPYLEFLIYKHCRYVIKNAGNPDKIGSVLSPRMVDCVQGLFAFVYQELVTKMGFTSEAEMVDVFGSQVSAHGQLEDANLINPDGPHGPLLQWYTDDAARAAFKLSFRGGVAAKWTYEGGGKGMLGVYDTGQWGDAIEHGGSLFALDRRGRFYVGGRPRGLMDFKHSSFMAGAATLCAGTMRVDHGQVTWISGRSGHYRPTVLQMVTALERLRSYGVNLGRVTVYRENFTQLFDDTPFNRFEGCPATDLMRLRAWPTGVAADSMRVG